MAKFDDERVQAIVLGPRAFRTIPFPGHADVTVAVRCLTEAEIDGCRVEAQRKLRDLCKRRGWAPDDFVDVDPETHTRLVERQIIWRAYYDPDTVTRPDPEPFFTTDEQVDKLDSSTVTRLMDAYIEHQEHVNPLRSVNEDGFLELLDNISKGQAPRVLLAEFEPNTLRRLLLFMVSAVHSGTLQISKSSTGSSVAA